MAALPSYVKILFKDYGEEIEPDVEATDMESGPQKLMVRQSLPKIKREANLLIEDKANYQAFKTWYLDTINRVDWWDYSDPVDEQVKKARFFEGKLGKATPVQSTLIDWIVPCVIETWG